MAKEVTPSESPAAVAYREHVEAVKQSSRLSLPFPYRLPLAITTSFMTGTVLGVSKGAQTAGFRFRAENAHRLPQTPTGWYLYHKSKNYNMALGAVREGLKMGVKVSFWATAFLGLEDCLDEFRSGGGHTDFLSTVGASLTIAGAFSVWSGSSRSPIIEEHIVDRYQIDSRCIRRPGPQRQALSLGWRSGWRKMRWC